VRSRTRSAPVDRTEREFRDGGQRGEGVGPKTLRALALASELIHGTPASLRDPARFAFAHGGKDGTAINRSAIDRSEKVQAFQCLARFQLPRSPQS